jgi:hypothetical protein
LALMLAIGGGMWANPSADAASEPGSSSASASASTSTSTDKTAPAGQHGKRSGGLLGIGPFESQLADNLKLSAEDLKEKLKTATLAEIASEQGISREDLKAKLVEWLDAQAAKLPSDKTDKLEKLDSAAIADKLLDAEGSILDGSHRKEGGKGAIAIAGDGDNTDLLELLGLTAEELKTELRNGQSLAAIAENQGIDVQKIIGLEVSQETAKLDEALSSAKITQEQYDAKLADVTDMVTKQVNGTFKQGPKGGSHPGGRFINSETANAAGGTKERQHTVAQQHK